MRNAVDASHSGGSGADPRKDAHVFGPGRITAEHRPRLAVCKGRRVEPRERVVDDRSSDLRVHLTPRAQQVAAWAEWAFARKGSTSDWVEDGPKQ